MATASAVNQLHAAGVLVVAGAGNNQSGTASDRASVCSAEAVSVAAGLGRQRRRADLLRVHGCDDRGQPGDLLEQQQRYHRRIRAGRPHDVVAPGAGRPSRWPALPMRLRSCPRARRCSIAAHPSATPDQVTAALRHVARERRGCEERQPCRLPRLDCTAADAVPGAPSIPASRAKPGGISRCCSWSRRWRCRSLSAAAFGFCPSDRRCNVSQRRIRSSPSSRGSGVSAPPRSSIWRHLIVDENR